MKTSVRFASQCQFSAYRKAVISQRGEYTRGNKAPVQHVSRAHSPSLQIEGMAHAIFAAVAFGAGLLSLIYLIGSLHMGAPLFNAAAALVCFLASGMLCKDQAQRAAQYL